MGTNPRHDSILALLQNYRQISVAELTERLGVTPVTVRKDLNQMEEMGLVIRSHGSARLAQAVNLIPSVANRNTRNHELKERIADRAIELLREADNICIDAGSTTAILAERLPDMPLRVVTNSIHVVSSVQEKQSISLTMLGGSFRKEAGSFIGPIAIETLTQLRFDIAFIGATSFTADGEFFSQNIIENSVKQQMLQQAKLRVILADSSKFETRAFAKFASTSDVDMLITDSGFTGEQELRRLGLEVVLV